MHGVNWNVRQIKRCFIALLAEDDAVLQVSALDNDGAECIILEVTGVYDKRDAEHKLVTLFGADFASAIDLTVA